MRVLISAPNRALVVPYRGDTATLFPHGQVFDFNGERMMRLPYRTEEARVLRNMGVEVPSPILFDYDWRQSKPFAVQRDTASMLTLCPRAYVLSGMGVGKTRAALYAADYLMKRGEIQSALVCAPLSTLHVVWRMEIMRIFHGRRVQIVHGTREQRLHALAQDADFYVINHDGVSLFYEELKARAGLDLLIIDELSVFRNGSSSRTKAMTSLAREKSWVWGLTGSPTPQAPSDAWAQARIVTPERVPRTMTAFRDKVMQRVSNFTWVPRADSAQIVADVLKPSVRFKMEDVMELPPVSYNRREATLTPQASKAYKELVNQCRSVLSTGAALSAVNEGVLVGKLLQVSCGLVYDDQSKVQDLGMGDRYSVVTDTIDATDRKVIVFVPYLHALHALAAKLKKDGYDIATIDGSTSANARNDIFTRFESAASPRVLVAHPRTMSHGVTLVAANTVIWFSPAPSFEIYEQANARIRRPGQSHKQLIVEIAGTPAEKVRYRQLRGKEQMQGTLLALLNGVQDD